MKTDNPLVLILCGGQSLRLWPLSEYRSKNFVDIFGFSPLQETVRRFRRVTGADNIFLAASQTEKESFQKIDYVKPENIFFEPARRNTAAAVLLSLFFLKKKFAPHRELIIVPVDHFIKKEKDFLAALRRALRAARRGVVCTLGIKPRYPTSNLGYIQAGREVAKGIFAVEKFIEKPSPRRAKAFIRRGNAFYNSGMFVASLHTLEKEYARYYPYYEDFCEVFRGPAGAGQIARLYHKIEEVPFDKAIMEKTKKARLVKARFSWKDFGDWGVVYDLLPKDKAGNVKKGRVSIPQGKNNLIYLDGSNKKVLVNGLDNVIFIDTPQYTLLSCRRRLDDLKAGVKNLKKA